MKHVSCTFVLNIKYLFYINSILPYTVYKYKHTIMSAGLTKKKFQLPFLGYTT